MNKANVHNPDCRTCTRLATFLDETAKVHPGYFCKPVPPFGVTNPRLLIVGLAPGMHGANRTGRPFTGDYAGVLLYETLHKFGFSSQPVSESASDKLKLIGTRITNAVKCLPPQNKPDPTEVKNCNAYLAAEIATLKPGSTILALGVISHEAVLRAAGLKPSTAKFAHGARHALPREVTLFDSYHCSRYNTNTRRLTPEMFCDVFQAIRAHLDSA